jgi:uncharacterized membrane protein
MSDPVTLVEEVLTPLATATRLLLESLSVLTVLYGLIATAGLFLPRLGGRLPERPSNRARLIFASWLALALEFLLAADIVSTTTAPSQENLIKLGVVTVIRTFLNLFLAQEIEAEQRIERDAAAPFPREPLR